MVRLTLIARVLDGLPLAEGLDAEKADDIDVYKSQAKVGGGSGSWSSSSCVITSSSSSSSSGSTSNSTSKCLRSLAPCSMRAPPVPMQASTRTHPCLPNHLLAYACMHAEPLQEAGHTALQPAHTHVRGVGGLCVPLPAGLRRRVPHADREGVRTNACYGLQGSSSTPCSIQRPFLARSLNAPRASCRLVVEPSPPTNPSVLHHLPRPHPRTQIPQEACVPIPRGAGPGVWKAVWVAGGHRAAAVRLHQVW